MGSLDIVLTELALVGWSDIDCPRLNHCDQLFDDDVVGIEVDFTALLVQLRIRFLMSDSAFISLHSPNTVARSAAGWGRPD